MATDQCTAQRKAEALKNNVEFTDCYLTAQHSYAVAIKLKKMDLFDAYAARLRMLAAQRDAGSITLEEIKTRAAGVEQDYFNSIAQAASIDVARRARTAAIIGAMGEAAERQADRDAYIRAHNRSVSCTSTTFGSQVNTTCH